MTINKIIEHVTKAVNSWVAKSNYLTSEEVWKDLIVRECEDGNAHVEILFDGGYCYDMINETWCEYGGEMNWDMVEEIFGLKALEKKGHEAEPYASWKISIYK